MRTTGDCDFDNIVTSLQATYPEYSRRKRRVFQKLVGNLMLSLDASNNGCYGDERLEEVEWQHFKKRMREAEEREAEEGQDYNLCVVTCRRNRA